MQDGYEYARDIIASGKKFTAVICVNDLVALGEITLPRNDVVESFDGCLETVPRFLEAEGENSGSLFRLYKVSNTDLTCLSEIACEKVSEEKVGLPV